MSFEQAFRSLTDHEPFPWQKALYEEFLHAPPFRTACDLPTGLGKTSIIAIWLLALAERARARTLDDFPRRQVYVVNRRTVVDQSTEVAKKLLTALDAPELAELRDILRSLAARTTDPEGRPLPPLAISTLRGEFADNAEWRDDPARPAIIVGTVDMIGSRLLFSGYGRGFKTRPLHAGFLAQDALLVHDEAHLEPALQQLLEAIVGEQRHCKDWRRLHVMALTATRRSLARGPRNESSTTSSLLSDADRADPEAARRLEATKSLRFRLADANDIAPKVADLALAHMDSKLAILIFLRELKSLEEVAKKLHDRKCKVQRLTGTMRGLEREQLLRKDGIFARFYRRSAATPLEGTVYLVCTSAGEVGIDMSADHMVCDLTPFDSIAQRLGRVNRFGTGSAQIDIVYTEPRASTPAKSNKNSTNNEYEERCRRTLELLRKLPDHNASPAALANLDAVERSAAFTPEPTILPATNILFDAWALTTARDLPGRPAVDDWLHGVADWEPPETHVAWRKEVKVLNDLLEQRLSRVTDGPSERLRKEFQEELLEQYPPDELLDYYPLKPHELLRDRYDRVFDELKTIAARTEKLSIWTVGNRDRVEVTTLQELIGRDKDALRYKTVILPPQAGGLGFTESGPGFLQGKAEYVEDGLYDVADEWIDADDKPRRCRLWDDDQPSDPSMRRVRVIDTRPDADENLGDTKPDAQPSRRFWRWYVRPRSADDEGSRTARDKQDLQPHLLCAGVFADAIVAKLGLADPEATAVRLAAQWHDLGKNRQGWQNAIGNRSYAAPRIETAWAKSGNTRSLDTNKYRHELGSLIDLQTEVEFLRLDEDTRDLVMHLIAAHHGRARPHFPAEEAFDVDRPHDLVDAIVRAVPQRFARLQRKYGRWGLAYLESLVRAADIMASQEKFSATVLTPTFKSNKERA
jgi:CRISPR-associated endonuclease/helicase Cas3